MGKEVEKAEAQDILQRHWEEVYANGSISPPQESF